LTNGIAEAMMHSIHKSDQSVPIRSLASLDQAGLSQAQVISAVRKKQSGIDECYDRASARRPGIDGHAEFIFSIAPSGQLTDVQIGQSTLPKHTGLQNCVKDVLRQTKFSPSGKGTTSMIDLPFKPKMVP
jgi:TonB family protein